VADLPSVVSGALPARRPIADVLYEQMVDAGQPFWAAVYRPFTSQKVTHADVQALVARGLEQTQGSYKGLVRLFNLPGRDYRRFLKFLKKNECRPPVLEFRPRPAWLNHPIAADRPLSKAVRGSSVADFSGWVRR